MKKIILFICFAFCIFTFGKASAQDLFLKVGTLTAKGSFTKGFEDYIEISGLQYGVEAQASIIKGSGSTVGKPNFSEIIITKGVDIMTNEFLRAIAKGTPFPALEVVSVGTNGRETPVVTHKVELKDVFVTSVSNSGDGNCGGDCPSLGESVRLIYKAIKITTYSRSPKTGEVTANPNPFVFNVADMTQTF